MLDRRLGLDRRDMAKFAADSTGKPRIESDEDSTGLERAAARAAAVPISPRALKKAR